jgi:hypothetical protein
MNFSKRQIFRWLIDVSESVNFWIQETFNLNPKRAILEQQQDLITVQELENTIGKSLGINNETK